MNLNNSQGNNSSSNNDNNNDILMPQMIMDQENIKEVENNINNNIINKNDIKNYETISDKEKEEKSNNNNNLNCAENEEIKNEKNNYNNVTISNLLFQLKQMSDKQLYLLDIISNLQKNSSEQINNLNKRIKYLEEKLIKQNGENNKYFDDEESMNHMKGDGDNLNDTLTKLLNGNKNEKLIKYLNELKLEQIKKLDIKLIEDTLIKLCILLTEGFKVHEIICFIKGILIINKIKLKEITKKNLKDVFNYVQQNLTSLKDEDSIDMSLIISYLNI